MKLPTRLSAALLALAPAIVLANTATADDYLASGTRDACRAEVSKFERAIGFVRQNQGNQAAADLKERLLPAKLENDLLMQGGYCGLAKYLQEKKLLK